VQAATADHQAGSVTVAFAPPTSDGGSPVTEYRVRCRETQATQTGGISPVTLTGLPRGQELAFELVAVNAVGPGFASAPSRPTRVNTGPVYLRADLTAARAAHVAGPQTRQLWELELRLAQAEDEEEQDDRQVRFLGFSTVFVGEAA
jgi:hypothetical protein